MIMPNGSDNNECDIIGNSLPVSIDRKAVILKLTKSYITIGYWNLLDGSH